MEKNRKILDEALQQLRTYVPDDEVWDAVQSGLPDASLAAGLSEFKSIDPPEIVWDAIANDLDKKEKISQLKEYTPGDEIWENIDNRLNESSGKVSRLRYLSIISWTAAASVLLMIAYFLLFPNQPKSNISYSHEIIETESPELWQNEDTEIFDLLNSLCAAKPLACKQPEFIAKKEELDYLNEKTSEILERMNAYDQNKDLQILLTKIELEKNEIVKQMLLKVI